MSRSGKQLIGNCALTLLLAFSLPLAHAQETDKEDHFKPLPDGTYRFSNQHGTRVNQDYYLDPNTGPPNSTLLHKVERHHLGQKEWDNLAKGQYDSALNDVKYTLRRFPNHPTALMMISIIAKMTDRKKWSRGALPGSLSSLVGVHEFADHGPLPDAAKIRLLVDAATVNAKKASDSSP